MLLAADLSGSLGTGDELAGPTTPADDTSSTQLALSELAGQAGATGNMMLDELVTEHTYDPSSVVVQLAEGISPGRLIEEHHWTFTSYDALSLVPGLVRATLASGVSVDDARALLSRDGWVSAAEPDYYVSINEPVFPDDPSFTSLWGLHNTGQSGGTPDADIDAPEAWETTTGQSSVIVAVIDTGVEYTHPDLVDNIWTNPGEIPDDGIDNDGNGFVDDVYGWDFFQNDNDPMDEHSHGTHVAGTIAAVGDNDLGVTGVSWNATIMSMRFLGPDGSGSTFGALQSLDYAVAMGATVSNNSYGSPDRSTSFGNAIGAAGDAGHVFVAAAGNSATDNDNSSTPHYPSNHEADNLIAVAATNRNDALSWFSSYGATTVDLGAPGSSIRSTVLNGGYGSKSGTSMAAPHVAGAAALVLSIRPDFTPLQVKDALLAGVDPVPALDGKTVTGGRLNAAGALQAAAAAGPEIYVALDGGNVLSGTTVLDAGQTVEGLPVVGTLTVSNIGLDPQAPPLELSDVLLPDGFSLLVDFEPLDLASGESMELSIQLDAATPGSYSGTLSLVTNDADENPFAITLLGQVVADDDVRIVDDGDAGFFLGSESWIFNSSAGYQGDEVWTFQGSGEEFAFWQFPVHSGVYQVAAGWDPHFTSATDTPFTISDGITTLETVTVDQSSSPGDFTAQGGPWQVLGQYQVLDNLLDITVTNEANGNVVADAIRIERIAGISVQPTTGLTTTEAGGTAAFTVVLESEPAADVTIELESSNLNEATVSPQTITFTPADWDTPQTVTATGVDDAVDDGNQSLSVLIGSATSDDPLYNGLDPTDVRLQNQDDDTAGLTVAPSGELTVSEDGGTDTLSVMLDSQPVADVTVEVAADTQLLVSTDGGASFNETASLTFTPADAFTAQDVLVQAVDDELFEEAHQGTIAFSASGSDANYDRLAPMNASAVITDNDALVVLGDVTINDGSPSRSMITELSFRLNADVTITEDAFELVSRNTGEQVLIDWQQQPADDGGSTVTLTMLEGPSVQVRALGNTLEDANYQLRIDSTAVTSNGTQLDGDRDGTPGGDYLFGAQEADAFYRWFGDSDGDRDVDARDFARFGATYRKRSGEVGFDASLDYDGDGDVDAREFSQFAQRYRQRLLFL